MKRNSSKEALAEYINENHLQATMNTDLPSIAELQEFEKDEFLIRSDCPSKYLYFLVKGEVVVTYADNDRTLCVGYLTPLSWLGEAASLWNLIPNCGVQSLTPCICVSISLEKYRDVLLNDILFLQNTCILLSCKLNETDFSPKTLLEPLEMRLAKFILRYSSQNIFSFRLTTCALILNASYRHLLRIIKEFCGKDILVKKKSSYLIQNRQLLEKYAEDEVLKNHDNP